MRACAWFSRHFCASVATLAAVGAASSASAQQNSPRRADLFAPPPAIALTGLGKAPSAEPLAAILAAPEPPPVVAILDGKVRIQGAAPDSLDLAWSLLDDEHRALALALDDWSRAPEVGRDAQRRRMRGAIAAGYAARGFEPFWISAGGWREGAGSALARLKDAREDGLDLRAYKLPSAEKPSPGVEDELALSEAVAVYALQARGGRIQPERISRRIGARTTLPNPALAIAEVAGAGYRAGDTLLAFNPPHYGYQQLREKLAELRAQRASGLPGEEQFASAAEGLQTDADLLGTKSRNRRPAALAAASNSRTEAEIIANMERWRWLPRDMGDERVEVNIPDFELAVVRGGAITHRTRVIVGKEQTPTPIFSDEMVEIIVNPSWYVPQSIIQKEWRGGVGAGYQVSYRNGQMVVRQPPGEKNALGRVKFVFPNDYAVYMHDTPSRGLFGASHRAFSHGCMRVDQPFALAEAVLGPRSGWSEARVKKLIGPSERYINLSKPLPVHIQYFTTYVDESGRLVQRPDLYGYSARVRKALGLGG